MSISMESSPHPERSRRIRANSFVRLEQMSAARRLGAQIALVVSIGREDMRHALGDGDAAAVERRDLLGIVGQEADAQEAELAQHLGGRQVDALVGVEAELLV